MATVALEGGVIVQLVLGDGEQQALELVEHLAGLRVVGLEAVLDVRVEVVEDLGLGRWPSRERSRWRTASPVP